MVMMIMKMMLSNVIESNSVTDDVPVILYINTYVSIFSFQLEIPWKTPDFNYNGGCLHLLTAGDVCHATVKDV